MKVLIITLCISILISIYPASILALDSDDGSNQNSKRLTISAYFGTFSSGSAEKVETSMKAR